MYIKGVTVPDVERAIAKVSNLQPNRLESTGQGVNVTLRVGDSRGPYAKRGHSGRRTIAACYHAHFEFMSNLFERHPTAKIRSVMAIYDGVAAFNSDAPHVAYRDVGSLFHPQAYGNMCDCR